MSKLDDILEQHKEWLRGIKTDRLIGVGTEPTKQQVKDLMLELFKEAEYDPYKFVERVEQL